MSDPRELGDLIAHHRPTIVQYLIRHGRGILPFDEPDDLAQMVQTRALQQGGRFSYEGEEAMLAWLKTIARGVIADRNDHWRALKRDRRRVLRLTFSGDPTDPGAAPQPASSQDSPSMLAARREQLNLVVRVLASLPERDRDLVRWASQGVPLTEQAERLDVEYAAAQRAGLRALDRFRKTFRLAAGGALGES